MIKILLIVSLCVVLGQSACPPQGCPPMQCCVDRGSNLPDDERYGCDPLQEEGGRCFDNYTSNHQRGQYAFWCPCEEGLYCDQSAFPQTCKRP